MKTDMHWPRAHSAKRRRRPLLLIQLYHPFDLIWRRGCRTCRGRGIDIERRGRLNPALGRERLAADGRGLYHVDAEELLPNPELLTLAGEWARDYEVRFALTLDSLPEIQARFAQVDAVPAAALHPGVELNPNNTGTHVERCNLLERERRQLTLRDGAVTLTLRPWEITTVRLSIRLPRAKSPRRDSRVPEGRHCHEKARIACRSRVNER